MTAQPGTIEYDRIKAAQKFDLEHRPKASHWTAVSDEQVSRLLTGADLYLTSSGITIMKAEADAPGAND